MAETSEPKLGIPTKETLDKAMEAYARSVQASPHPIKCDCDRIGCIYDHSEHFKRKEALRRLIDREVRNDSAP